MTKSKASSKKIIHLMFSQTKDFVFFSVFTALIVTLEILSVVIIRGFINQIIVNKLYDNISLYVVPFILTIIGIISLMIFRSKFKTAITTNISKSLASEAYRSILYADLAEIQKKDIRVCVLNIVPNCEYIASEYIGKNILRFIETMTLIFGIIITSLIVQPILGLIMLLIIPFYIIAMKGLEIFVSKHNEQYNQAIQDNSQKIKETYDNIKNIKLLNGLEYESDSFDDLMDDYVSATNHRNIIELFTKTILCILFTAAILAIDFGVGGLLDKAGTPIDAGAMAFCIIMVPTQMIMVYRSLHFKLSKNHVESNVMQLDLINSLRSELRSEPVTNLDEIHSVKFKDVTFVDSDDNYVLNNISFEIKRGEKLGVLSADKNSKDVLFDLITKLTRPKEGSISINNCELSKISPIYLRNLITSVYPGNDIFNDSILNNICYPYEFDEYKYNDALYRSGLKSMIPNLPDKEHTVLNSEDNSELNKRVVFANAFYKDSKIYVLNEAASSFDAMAENDLINEIFKLKNKIVILETEKAYLLSKCDKILIIKDGEPIEYGKYDELIADKTSKFYKAIKNVGVKTAKIS